MDACLSYDRVFWAQAHLKLQFNWMSDNTRLWNDKFLSWGAPRPCSTCSSISHSSHECHRTSAEVRTPSRPQTPSNHPKEKGAVYWVQPGTLFHHCLSQTPSLLQVQFLPHPNAVPKGTEVSQGKITSDSSSLLRPTEAHGLPPISNSIAGQSHQSHLLIFNYIALYCCIYNYLIINNNYCRSCGH